MGRFLCLMAIPGLLTAQIAQVELGTPTLAYVFDNQAGGLRAIEGVPGAASVGPIVNVGEWLKNAVVAPSRNYAVAETAGGIVIIRLDGLTGSARLTEIPANAKLGFSPTGSGFVWASGNTLEAWTGMPDQPRKLFHAELEDIKADYIAVSDDGLAVAAVSAGVIFRLHAGKWDVVGGESVTAIQFLRNGHDLLSAGAKLSIWRKISGEVVEEELMPLDAPPANFAISTDERFVLLNGSALKLLNRDTGNISNVGSFAAAKVGPGSGDSVFVIGGTEGDNWILLAEALEPQLIAVGGRNAQ